MKYSKELKPAVAGTDLRKPARAARTLDLDILLFGSFQGELNGCHLPRPEIFDRQFVWQPLLALSTRPQR
ncbi:MAG: 2-amino-4-hydroxy-6-hydroxymethyldihydropteridine diphosphokinase [Porticoccaceae bacterium]